MTEQDKLKQINVSGATHEEIMEKLRCEICNEGVMLAPLELSGLSYICKNYDECRHGWGSNATIIFAGVTG